MGGVWAGWHMAWRCRWTEVPAEGCGHEVRLRGLGLLPRREGCWRGYEVYGSAQWGPPMGTGGVRWSVRLCEGAAGAAD